MKLILILCVIAYAAADDSHYDSKYDNFKVDEVIDNDRLMTAYTHCFIGDGKCTPEGKDIKKWIPESARSSCGKCTPKQKILVAKFIKAIQAKKPKEWEILSRQSDPEKKYSDNLKKFLAEFAP